jgi:hypothetical protein
LKLECHGGGFETLTKCEICVDLRARGHGGRAAFCWSALKLPAQPSERTLHASLYANNRYNRYALLDYDKIASRDGYVFVSGEASLLSQTFNRDLLVSIESEGGASQFIKLKLRAKPRKDDEAWSDWMTATERADLSPVPEPERIAVRYRVQPED